jgi:hypothetical protein
MLFMASFMSDRSLCMAVCFEAHKAAAATLLLCWACALCRSMRRPPETLSLMLTAACNGLSCAVMPRSAATWKVLSCLSTTIVCHVHAPATTMTSLQCSYQKFAMFISPMWRTPPGEFAATFVHNWKLYMHMSANCHMFAHSCAACAVCPRNGLLAMSRCDRQHTMHSIAISTNEQIQLPERSEHAVFCAPGAAPLQSMKRGPRRS